MIRSTILLLTFATLLLFSCGDRQPKGVTTDIIKFEDSLKSIMANSKIPGFSVAIVKGESVVYSNGFGYANLGNKDAYSISTIQPIASISKTIVGLALMKAVDQGYFSLETNINDILPFKIINPYHPTSVIKIKHLVTHTSGLVDNDAVFIGSYTIKPKPDADFRTFFTEYYTEQGKYYSNDNFSDAEPGEQFNYSNIASALVAYLIEIKSNLSFPEYTAKYIFEPLKMSDTHWFYDSTKANRYATLYEITKQTAPEYKLLLNSDNSIKPYTDITYPDGKLFSSTQDMTKYLTAMITGYSAHSGILTSSSFQTLFAKQFNETNNPTDLDPEEPNRAIFWAYDSRGRISHTGSDYGLTSFILFNPQTKVGHIVLFNTAFDGAENEKAIADIKLILSQIAKFEKAVAGQ